MFGKSHDELARFWDELGRGNDVVSSELDPMIADAVRRLHRAPDVEGADSAFLSRLKEELMQTQTLAYSASTIVSPPAPLNGHVAIPGTRQIPRNQAIPASGRRGRFSQFAVAALLLMTIGLGYRAFDPFGGESGGQSSIPAVIAPAAATPGTPEAEPTTTPYPMTDHAVIGMWQVQFTFATPGDVRWFAFDEEGRFRLVENLDRVFVGEWQATGDRTAELVFIMQGVRPPNLFDPDVVIEGIELDTTYFEVWQMSITIDESGTTMTLEGRYDATLNGEPAYSTEDLVATAVRMVADTANPAT